MIRSLSLLITNCISKSLNINESKQQWFRYGTEIILGKILNYSAMLFTAYLFGCFFETLLFLIFFVSLRKYTGGYHASKDLSCTLLSFCICFTAILLSNSLDLFHMRILTIFLVIMGLAIVLLLAPINHPNLHLSIAEKSILRKRSYSAIIVQVTIILITMLSPNFIRFAFIESFSAGSVAILICISKIIKQEVMEF